MERLIIFRCPVTGLFVQTSWPLGREGRIIVAPEGKDNEERRYEGRLHFINRKTGKLLGGRE
jgi:hypothetical protein